MLEAYREVYLHSRAARPHHQLCLSLAEYYGKSLDLLEVYDGLIDVRKEVDEAHI